MNPRLLTAVVLFVCLFGCNNNQPTAAAPAAPIASEDIERTTCNKHQGDCGEYKVISYDATWENGLGNHGAYVLEWEGLTIHAHCGSENCWKWSDSVGKTVIGDRTITDLITRYEPRCEDPLFVQNAIENHKQMTGKNISSGPLCQQTLIVEKIQVKGS
jgi:hypothetical protein